MQLELVLRRKVLHLASFEIESFCYSEMAYFTRFIRPRLSDDNFIFP